MGQNERLAQYYGYFLNNSDQSHVSSPRLARRLGFEAITVRKDLQAAGVAGTHKAGFKVSSSLDSLASFLGMRNPVDCLLCGENQLCNAFLVLQPVLVPAIRPVEIFSDSTKQAPPANSGLELVCILSGDKDPQLWIAPLYEAGYRAFLNIGRIPLEKDSGLRVMNLPGFPLPGLQGFIAEQA